MPIALFHLIFTLIKIAILACIYATLVLVAFQIVGKYNPKSWFYKLSRRKGRLWFRSGFIISVGLFLFMFTHFGDHGWGDMYRVPVGHWKSVYDVDGRQAFIQEDDIATIDILKFIITDDYVYGMIGGDFNDNKDKFFVYDLSNNIVNTFKDESKYARFLQNKKLDPAPTYKDFDYYYTQYWDGWRQWLLP